MAVTEILGTDSLSSSRITLNDNFTSLEDEITSLKGYLDPTALTLSGVTISTSQIAIDGGTAVNASSATFGVASTFSNEVNFSAGITKGGINGTSSAGLTSLPANLLLSSYFVDVADGGTPLVLSASTVVGKEITLIATSAGDIEATNVAGAASIAIVQNGTLTLRSDGTSWYIIGSFGATIA